MHEKYYLDNLTAPPNLGPHCRRRSCVNVYNTTVNLDTQASHWWKTRGAICNKDNWQYVELLANPSKHEYIYRISIYNEHYILLQLYLDKHFASSTASTYSWRQIY